jgi:catechol 2,3-dioxygenase-like lactoylglutathione lyase family enzyme
VTIAWATRTYHTGIRVPDIEAAMVELGDSMGVTWCSLQDREQDVWTPEGGAQKVPLRFTYSAQGPQHLELLQGAAGTIWDGSIIPGIHHTGVWVDDVAAETNALLAKGWTLAAAGRPPEQGFGSFTYVVPPSGLIVELVNAALEPMFDRWFAGGPLG